ncbi:DUF2059 domain-containing protein [uncultured Victivallis sp.]|uniref:DUF2059 domain-containing protein n=1 Tax=uncultured Victivallis sp. TaxID=354118 RepID=UPI0025974BF4|nr:DUF2059 domain-containing protein [uncultured Victivallis sp.]
MKIVSIAVAFTLAAAAGFSAENPVRQPRLEDRMLAYALLEAEGTPQMMEQTLKTSLEAQLKAAPELLAYRQAFEMYLRNTISFEAQKEELARIYLEVYAPDEIRELIRFYQTPIGRKKAAAGSRIATAAAQVTQKKMQEYLPVFQQQLEQMQKEELRRKAELLQSRLPEPAPAPQQPAVPGKDAGKPNEEK